MGADGSSFEFQALSYQPAMFCVWYSLFPELDPYNPTFDPYKPTFTLKSHKV
jgi:hypothetical protein